MNIEMVKFIRKKLFALPLHLIVVCLLVACRGTSSEGSEYSWSPVQYELPSGTSTFNLTVDGAVDVFMAKMNVGMTVIPAANTRYVVSDNLTPVANQRSVSSSKFLSYSDNLLKLGSLKDVSGITASGIIREDFPPARDFVPPNLEIVISKASSRSTRGASSQSVIPINPEIGKTKKKLWVDIPRGEGENIESKFSESDSMEYTKRQATLQAAGKYCYIWVLDAYFDPTTPKGSQISGAEAEALANKFDEIYLLIREVFGKESNKIFHMLEGKQSICPIDKVSDTGEKVNIVVYDIEGDYSIDNFSGVVGYFWSKDYYSNEVLAFSDGDSSAISNEGKYFYVDSGILNRAAELIYTTLAHEFQHLISFGQKTISTAEKGKQLFTEVWFDEMMSMVCEEMIQEFLDISDEFAPISFLPYFCEQYYCSGVVEWLDQDNFSSYSGVYAFGTYLARNYGGVDLFRKISTNEYVDKEAITQGLKAIGSKETFDTVFKKYAQALLLDNPPSDIDVPSFNKSIPGIGGNMEPIDIFNLTSNADSSGYSRPMLLGTDEDSRVDLRPYGFTLHHLGYTQSAGTIQVNFSSPVNNQNEKIYILIQPHKER